VGKTLLSGSLAVAVKTNFSVSFQFYRVQPRRVQSKEGRTVTHDESFAFTCIDLMGLLLHMAIPTTFKYYVRFSQLSKVS
jgi:hypothetical protein